MSLVRKSSGHKNSNITTKPHKEIYEEQKISICFV